MSSHEHHQKPGLTFSQFAVTTFLSLALLFTGLTTLVFNASHQLVVDLANYMDSTKKELRDYSYPRLKGESLEQAVDRINETFFQQQQRR